MIDYWCILMCMLHELYVCQLVRIKERKLIEYINTLPYLDVTCLICSGNTQLVLCINRLDDLHVVINTIIMRSRWSSFRFSVRFWASDNKWMCLSWRHTVTVECKVMGEGTTIYFKEVLLTVRVSEMWTGGTYATCNNGAESQSWGKLLHFITSCYSQSQFGWENYWMHLW